jgi:hypothetical protein
MLLKLNGHISNCLERAANAEHRALQSSDSATRCDNELLAQSWRHLARSYQFVESLQRFLSETDRNKKETTSPEMLAVVEEQLLASEGQPVSRRRRGKHESSFNERLLKSAQDARDQASRLPAGAERDRLLQKAQQSETAAEIDAWVSSPGSRPPINLAHTKNPRD